MKELFMGLKKLLSWLLMLKIKSSKFLLIYMLLHLKKLLKVTQPQNKQLLMLRMSLLKMQLMLPKKLNKVPTKLMKLLQELLTMQKKLHLMLLRKLQTKLLK
jgi:hypothetical protein